MPKPLPKHVYAERTRHDRVVFYFRKGHTRRIRLPDDLDSAEFDQAYAAALAGAPAKVTKGPAVGTLSWLIARYAESSEWSDLSAATRKQRTAVYRVVAAKSGSVQLARINQASILAGRDQRRDRPHAANNFLKAMRGLLQWAVDRKHATVDPTRGVRLLAGERDDVGFHAWTEEEITRFEDRWPIGTRQRLALDLLLYTGLRRGDAVRLGRQHMIDDEFSIRTEKTGAIVRRPLLRILADSIARTPTGALAFLVTERGLPFGSKESFGTWFGKACRQAGVPGSAHGLRKAGARRAAEAGATEAQLNALFGWAPGSRESATYVRTADNARLARSAPVLPAPPRKGAGLKARS